MTFEEILESLNKRSIMLSNLGQIEDGKRWSVSVRKKGDYTNGYGTGKTIEKATKEALASLKGKMTDKQWKEFAKTQAPIKGRKKRVKLKR